MRRAERIYGEESREEMWWGEQRIDVARRTERRCGGESREEIL